MQDKITKRILKNNKGSAIIETAIALPIVLGLFMGLFFFTNAVRYKLVMNMAAKEGARMYQISSGNATKAKNKAEEELALGRVDGASVSIITNGVKISKSYGFHIPLFGSQEPSMKSEHEFFEELEARHYKKAW